MTFHYKSDDASVGRPLQYGLIAEEVDKVFPELVTHSANGQIETVMYQYLPPMLLNEYQKQERTIEEQARQIEYLKTEMRELQILHIELTALKAMLSEAASTKIRITH